MQTLKSIILNKVDKSNIMNIKNYQQVFDIILTNLNQTQKYNNQSQKYDEEKGLKIFMEKHNKGNIIQKLFLIPKEEKITCKKCGMNTYEFGYDEYIYIENPILDLISTKLIAPQKEMYNKGIICNFCNGQEIEYSIEKKY